MRRFLESGLTFALAASAALGQSNVASVTGIITDPSGAVVSQAEVVISNRNTGIEYRTTANEAGVYVAPSLIVGPYNVEIRATGFKSKQIQNVVLEVGQKVRLDVTLEVGAVTEQIEVQATAVPLMQETVEISKTISATEVRDLPFPFRNPQSLLGLVPGVAVLGNDPNRLQNYGLLSINGSRAAGNAFVIDGAALTHVQGLAESPGPVEAIQEFKVLASTYSAEYGRTSGGIVIFQVKSGTQKYHGSLYEYNRNKLLNANDWASNANRVKRATFTHNEFGVSVGGPVPGMSKKLFFFANYDGLRPGAPLTRSRTIPDPSIRSGNFSGLPAVINDPLSGTPFTNNTIPSSRLDPAAVKFLQLFPAPNTEGTFNPQFGIRTNNWFRASNNYEPHNYGILRLDYNPGDKHKLFFTFSHLNEDHNNGVDFGNALNSVNGPNSRDLRRATFGYTLFLRPNLTNEFLAAVSRDPRVQYPFFKLDVAKELGIERKIGEYMPSISISGFGGFGNSLVSDEVTQPAMFSDIITSLRGRHTMRFGAQLYQNQYWYTATSNDAGSYSFNGDITGLGAPGRNNPLNALADLLLGTVKTASLARRQIPVNRVNYNLGLFFNDDWKVTNRLTLNLGLRYEFETRLIVKNNVYSRIDLDTGNLLVAGKNASRNLNLNNDYVNFSPRLGVAYSLNDKTVIRSGFAVFHNNFWLDNGGASAYPGWTLSQVYEDQGVGRAQPFAFTQGFPVEQVPVVPDPLAVFAAATPQRPLSISTSTYNPTDRLPYNIQWSLGVQRDIGFGTVLEVGYVASRSAHLARKFNPNNPTLDRAPEVVINRVPIQQVRPFPNLGNFGAVFYDATSFYNSLQARATHRFSSGFSVDANYTFSKNIDTASLWCANFGSDSFQIPWQFPNIERAISCLDRPQMFSLGWMYELPFGKGKSYFSGNRLASALLSGFLINGILSASDGMPLTITQNKTNLILNAQRPDVIDSSNLSGRVEEPAFVGAARTWLIRPGEPGFPFTGSSNLGFGNLGRNTSRMPGFWNLNLSVFRAFPITEQIKLQLRFEAFNAFNHVNFFEPPSNINSASYGLSTGAAPARQVQVGARLSF